MILHGGEPFFFPGGPVGCLLIHGYLSTPGEMRPLGQKLSTAGFTALGIRLAGHAHRPRDLKSTEWEDWIASVEDGYHTLRESCDAVLLIGMSLGGVIALLSAHRLEPGGVVTISTPYDLIPYRRLRFLSSGLPILRLLAPFVHYMPKFPAWDYVDPGAAKAHLTYKTFPTRSLLQLDRLFHEMRQSLPKLKGPILLIHSRSDRGVPVYNLAEIKARISSPEVSMMEVENSGHVILLEPEGERVVDRIIEFVAQFE